MLQLQIDVILSENGDFFLYSFLGNGVQTGPEARGCQFSYAGRSNGRGPINPQLPGTANNQTVMTTISNGRDPRRAFKRWPMPNTHM